jgi:hypothetical protein
MRESLPGGFGRAAMLQRIAGQSFDRPRDQPASTAQVVQSEFGQVDESTSIPEAVCDGGFYLCFSLKFPRGLRYLNIDMALTARSIDINAPLRAVYDRWTCFEEFPIFLEGVEEVRLDSEDFFCGRTSR